MKAVNIVLFLLYIAFTINTVQTQCPDAGWTGSRWSLLFPSANSNSNLTISTNQLVLFDVTSATVRSISIFGSLVFSTSGTGQNLTVSTIRVEPTGSFIMGSPSCPIPPSHKTVLTFTGTRAAASGALGSNPADGFTLGDKGLAVCNDGLGNGGKLRIYGQVTGPSWVRLSATAVVNSTSITVDKPVSWKAGDHIVVASTDFGPVIDFRTNTYPSLSSNGLVGFGSPDQSEEAVIASITNSGLTINLVSKLKYLHWGQGYERAEVGLLTRSILVKGDDAGSFDSFGGHLIFRNASDIQIQGAEFTQMGQKGIIARYPIHFHMNFEHPVGKGFVIGNNSIHHNFQRCITVHATNGVWVGNNVAFITNGHCYFLEDGSEELNVFDQNLGVSPAPVPSEGNPIPPIIPSDVSAGVYWIANPNNAYTGNVAVGGAFGFWFGMPVTPTGPSAFVWPAATTNLRPRNLPLLKFANNVAHSATIDGIEVDLMPDSNLNTALAGYNPYRGPYVVNGTLLANYYLTPVEAVFENSLAYKNRNRGIWTRGGPIRHTGCKILDNKVGFNNPPGPSIIEDSEIWGETDNVGTLRVGVSADTVRQNPDIWGGLTQIKGHETYDNGGPQYARRVKFYNYTNLANRPAGAFGALTNGPFGHQTRNRYHSIIFNDASVNRVTLPDSTSDAPKCGTIYITDGSVIPESPAGGWILSNVTPGQLMLYPNSSACVYHSDWNAWGCPVFGEGYIQFAVQFPNVNAFAQASGAFTAALFNMTNTAQTSTPGFKRALFYPLGATNINTQYQPVAGRLLSGNVDLQFLINLAPRTGYALQLLSGSETPKTIKLSMTSSVGGDWMVAVLPYPTSAAPFTISYTNYGSSGKSFAVALANSTNDLKQLSYYWDGSKGLLYLWLENVQMNSWTNNWGFTDYSYDGGVYTIVANGCYTATCGVPAASAVSTIPSVPSVIRTKEDTYKTDLVHACNDSLINDGASGKAWVYLDTKARSLHISISHNRPNDVMSVKIFDTRRQNRLLVDLSSTLSSPVRRVIPYSYETWTSLALGSLQVVIKYGSSSIGGKLRCESSSDCTLPPSIPNPAVCSASVGAAGLKVQPVFFDGPLPNWPRWSNYSWSASYDVNKTVITDTVTSPLLCGNSSLGVGIQNGALALGYPGSLTSNPPVPTFTVDTTIYTFFEFWVIPSAQTPSVSLDISFSNGTMTFGPVTATASYVLNYLIENTGWNRVRIPMTAFGVLGVFTVNTFTIRQSGYANSWAQLYFDNIVFTNGQDGAPNTPAFSIGSLALYSPSQCGNLVLSKREGASDAPTLYSNDQEIESSGASVVGSWLKKGF